MCSTCEKKCNSGKPCIDERTKDSRRGPEQFKHYKFAAWFQDAATLCKRLGFVWKIAETKGANNHVKCAVFNVLKILRIADHEVHVAVCYKL